MPSNQDKIRLAADAIYATQGIEGEAAEARGLAVRAIDAFYAAAIGVEVGALIKEMEATPASKRWREWDAMAEEPTDAP